ncbi:hypothetical protein NDI76_22045 [Halogeometricum sp. S1BR25-6]|uniref:Uncharacterized protein n=1 Tax=Halogeometricum salsisoli TaxID=2950536 RepID=A0ABU2GKV0_9EURY|nr:hypothetical protein [Halogeometricum sp. S1BR25-6]MDS0301415.1 hypothetical protein [Halogeometricum sp. S1BR25-6]
MSAHGGSSVGGLSQSDGILIAVSGAVLLGGGVLLKRTSRITPTTALYTVFLGLALTAFGAILFESFSPDPTYSAASIPFPRAWYTPISLVGGILIMVGSLVAGRLRWPDRPRYTFLGILLGAWISYPGIVPDVGSSSHPLGYLLVLGTPVLVGYIVWKDASTVLAAVLRDPVARRFGIGVGFLVGLFFMSVSGYLSFFWEEGAPHEMIVTVLPVTYQLVTWPMLEVWLPQIPLLFAISPGHLIVVGLLSALTGLNAAVVASHWRAEERAGTTEGTAGTAAIVGSCTCGCCGPLVAKVAILVAGPSVAAPLYWIFVDSASPLSSLFIVLSIALFTGSLVYSVASARRRGQSTSIVPAD